MRYNRISPMSELSLLIQEAFLVLIGETRNLIISIIFPFIAMFVTVWIAGEDMYENFEATKSACFIVVCAAIWCGLFNSIQVVVKERAIIKREYVSGALRLCCYTGSRTIIQTALCFIQSLVLSLSFPGVELIYGNDMPRYGLAFDGIFLEFFISVFLIMLAADALGLMISCFVKSEQLASQLSPYILIVQLLFSGVLFPMEGAASAVSVLMLSRWGMEALGSSCDLNDLPLRLQEEMPNVPIPHEADDAFSHEVEHLLVVWLIMLAFIIVPIAIGNFGLHRVKHDSRD